MKALVTGASGLIGSNIVRQLVDARHDVRGMVRPTSDLRGLRGVDIELVEGDVRRQQDLVAASEGCEVVFHTAAVFAYWGHDHDEVRRIAVEGAQNAVEAAQEAGVERVVLTSSSVTCGSDRTLRPRDEGDHIPDDEEAPDYFHAKAAAERAALARARQLGVELVAALPCITVGGPDYKPVPSNAHLLDYLKDPTRLSFPGGCNVVAVQDVAAAHILLAERGAPFERYLLGADNWEWSMIHRTISELCGISGPGLQVTHTAATLLARAWDLGSRLTGQRPPTTPAQARTLGRFYFYRNDRMRELGWEPVSTRTAIAGALGWLVASEHVDGALRRRIRLAPDVYDARRQLGWRPPEPSGSAPEQPVTSSPGATL